MGGIGVWQLLIVLAIILVLFGTRKLRSIGSDLGGAVQGFKSAVKGEKSEGEVDADQMEYVSAEGEEGAAAAKKDAADKQA